jgi:hypothetical protein
LVKDKPLFYQTFSTITGKTEYSSINNKLLMKDCITLMMFALISNGLFAQKPAATEMSDATENNSVIQTTTPNSNRGTVVNMEMINRFRSIKTEGDIYSWSQLLVSHDSRAVNDFLEAYSGSNPDEQSMQEIWVALTEKNQEYLNSDEQQPEDEYYVNIQRIKEEINQKLRSGNSVAMK